jgi:hypothetical protein
VRNLICAIARTVHPQQKWAAPAAKAVLRQTLPAADRRIDCVTFSAQLSQHFGEIHKQILRRSQAQARFAPFEFTRDYEPLMRLRPIIGVKTALRLQILHLADLALHAQLPGRRSAAV